MAVALALAPWLAHAETAAMLTYRVWEPGLEPYENRILVTPAYLRMDEGQAGEGFALLDRQQDIIYSVSDDEQTVVVINPPVAGASVPASLQLASEASEDTQAPAIAGRRPISVKLLANGATCRELVAVEGLMSEAVDGLRDFSHVLARVQSATLLGMPESVRTDCDLAELVFAADRWLAFGLPVEDNFAGRRQLLVDFNAATEVEGLLFAIPESYRRVGMPGLAAP
jgi:hypothetical protein